MRAFSSRALQPRPDLFGPEVRWTGYPPAVATISVGLLGFGRVGRAVVDLASSSTESLTGAGLRLRIAGALVRDRQKPRPRHEIDLLESPARFFEQRLYVVIEVMGGVQPAYDYVRHALESRIPVVTANKSLMASRGEELRDLSRRTGVPLAFDAAVLAGVPFIGALPRHPFIGAPQRITGILNGTSNFLACALASGRSFESALAEAVQRGYAEPDSAADISGRDAAEKPGVAHVRPEQHRRQH
jgi:homoserine dehydrogenase